MYKYDVNRGLYKIKTRAQKLSVRVGTGMAALLTGVVFALAPAGAAPTVIYNNIPSPQPGNMPSQAFEAQSASEFGGQVSFAGAARLNPKVTVLMSSWGCQAGHWFSGDCSTTPGATFSEPVTLNVYNVGAGNTVGTKIGTVTQTFQIPYRPSASPTCGDGRWSDGTDCFNGYATPISFNVSGLTLPNNAIISVAYNTTHFGYAPIGEGAACYTSAGGCGYDSLNVALTYPPTVGTVPNPSDAYLNSSWSGAYCDNGVSGTGSFRLDSGCWTGYQPAFKVEVNSASAADECKNNGWKSMTNPGPFKNQGDCVSYFATNAKNLPNGQ
jgi:hypothetical protein